MESLNESATMLLVAALGLFWLGMLGLLWRRSLIGMLVGVLFGWLSVALAGIAFIGFQAHDAGATGAAGVGSAIDAVGAAGEVGAVGGAAFVLCAALVGALQVALGLALVVARIERHGTLDAQDAGLLEG